MKNELLKGVTLFALLCAGCQHPQRIAEPRLLTDTLLPPLEWTEQPDLSLADTLRLALERNRSLRIAEMDPVRALTEVDAAEGAFAPEAFGSTQFGEEESSETARSTGERFAVEAEDRRSEIGIGQQFEIGTEVELTLSEQRDASNRAPTQQEVRAGLGITQPLLQGFGTRVNRIRIEQAILGVEISREELRAVTMAQLAETEIAYWNLYLAEEALEITRTALEVAEKQLEETRQRIDVGQLPQNQQAAAEAEVAQRKQALIDAEANLQTRRFRLNQLLFAPAEVQLTPGEALVIPDQPLTDTTPWVAEAAAKNPELREARARLLQDELDVVRTRDGIRPRLDFFAGLAKTGFGDSLSDAGSEFSGDTYEWVAGLQMNQDLGTTRSRAAFDDAQLAREQAELAVENLELSVESRVRRAIVEYNRALAQVNAGEQTVRLREQTAQAEQDRFDVGIGTSLLVAQAQRDLLESQIDDLRNRIASQTAKVNLLELTGTLLDHYGIEMIQE
jgi:outer membrane protein TolC